MVEQPNTPKTQPLSELLITHCLSLPKALYIPIMIRMNGRLGRRVSPPLLLQTGLYGGAEACREACALAVGPYPNVEALSSWAVALGNRVRP